MITLVPMTDQEYRVYYARAVAGYAAEHVRGGRWRADEAEQQARAEFDALLPAGVATPENFLYQLVDPAAQTAVGMLWYALQTHAAQRVAFIYDVAIDPAFRRRGYATQAFRALEQQARAQGVQQIRLHVFGHNYEARALYEKLGFAATNIMMAKALASE